MIFLKTTLLIPLVRLLLFVHLFVYLFVCVCIGARSSSTALIVDGEKL